MGGYLWCFVFVFVEKEWDGMDGRMDGFGGVFFC